MVESREKKKIKWDVILDKCPKCGSTDLERLNLYRGHYRRGNPLKLKNKQKVKCLNAECQYEFWITL